MFGYKYPPDSVKVCTTYGKGCFSVIGDKGSRQSPLTSVPASILSPELSVIHAAYGSITDYDPTPFTFKFNDLMGLNHRVEQRCWNLVNVTVRVTDRYQPPEPENSHFKFPFYLIDSLLTSKHMGLILQSLDREMVLLHYVYQALVCLNLSVQKKGLLKTRCECAKKLW